MIARSVTRTRMAALLAVLAVAAATVAACASTNGRAVNPLATGKPATHDLTPAIDPAGNHALAVTRAHHLSDLLPLPAAAIPFTGTAPPALDGPAMGTPANSHFVDAAVYWRVPAPVGRLRAWVTAHTPAGFSASGSSSGNGSEGVSLQAPADPAAPQNAPGFLEVAAVAAPGAPATSIWRIDGTVIWYDPTPTRDTTAGRHIHLTIAGGCPASWSGLIDIANPRMSNSVSLTDLLLSSRPPTAALVCRSPDRNPAPLGRQASHRLLSATQAGALARQARSLPTGSFGTAATSCPEDDDRNTVVVFAYPSGDVDLWWHESGCGFVDNGYITSVRSSLAIPAT